MDDITLLRRAVDDATRIVDGVRPDQRELPTPCPAFTVAQLLDHLVEGARMMTGALEGAEVTGAGDWKTAAERLAHAAETPGVTERTLTLPYGEFPGTVVIQQALGEIAIHTCDLARATGQSIGDDDVYRRVFEVVGDDWRVENVLGPAQPCAGDAPLADRVLAFAGRSI